MDDVALLGEVAGAGVGCRTSFDERTPIAPKRIGVGPLERGIGTLAGAFDAAMAVNADTRASTSSRNFT